MKIIILLLIFPLSLIAQDKQITTCYDSNDSIVMRIIQEGNFTYYENKSTIIIKDEFNDYGYIKYVNDTAYMLTIKEGDLIFWYRNINEKWEYEGMKIGPESKHESILNRCKALTGSITRCKRKGVNGYCWQHKK